MLFPGARLKQGSAPGAGGEESAEEDDGVDAGAAFGGPVDVAKVEPESEFVEGESGADAVEDRHEAAENNRGVVGAGADFGEPSVADEKKNDDADDEMMNVASAHFDEMEWRNLVGDAEDHAAHSGEGEEKTKRGDEEAAARAVGNAIVKYVAEELAMEE